MIKSIITFFKFIFSLGQVRIINSVCIKTSRALIYKQIAEIENMITWLASSTLTLEPENYYGATNIGAINKLILKSPGFLPDYNIRSEVNKIIPESIIAGTMKGDIIGGFEWEITPVRDGEYCLYFRVNIQSPSFYRQALLILMGKYVHYFYYRSKMHNLKKIMENNTNEIVVND